MSSHENPSGKGPDPARLVQVLAHPTRALILETLAARTASPSELATEFGLSLPLVSYHVSRLVKAGMLELVSTAPRRGALEHYYRASGRPEVSREAWAQLPEILRGILTEAVLRDLGDR